MLLIQSPGAPSLEAPALAPLVSIRDLSVNFGVVRALTDVQVNLPQGAVGLLGPNGAGKTTLLRVLLGHVRPDGGEVLVGGKSPATRAGRLAIRHRVGYMPEGHCLLAGMNAVDLVTLLGRLSGLAASDALTRAHEVLDYVGLEEARYRDCLGYSAGMKQRLKLAQTLVHDPPLLLLDEPTSGLDPGGRAHMLELIRDLGRQHGKSLLLCSHLLPDVEATCEHVVMLDQGRMVKAGRIQELTRMDRPWVQATLENPSESFTKSLVAHGFLILEETQRSLKVELPDGSRHADELLALAAAAGVVLSSLTPVTRSLEDVFFSLLSKTP